MCLLSTGSPSFAVVPLRGLNHLSDELLSRILRHTKGALAAYEDLSCIAPPLTYTQVDSRWRRVAIAASHLWSDIVVRDAKRCHFNHVRMQLVRADGQLLRIHYRYDDNGSHPSPSDYARAMAILRLLMVYSPQWQQATFFIHQAAMDILSGVRGQVPRLRFLHLELSETEDGWDEQLDLSEAYPLEFWPKNPLILPPSAPPSADPFAVAPALQYVHVGPGDPHLAAGVFPYPQLFHYHGIGPLRGVSSWTNLTTLGINFYDVHALVEPVLLPRVTTLSVPYCTSMFYLVLPSLVHLHSYTSPTPDEWARFLSRSPNTKLQSICITRPSAKQHLVFSHFLHSVPTITALVVQGDQRCGPMVAALARQWATFLPPQPGAPLALSPHAIGSFLRHIVIDLVGCDEVVLRLLHRRIPNPELCLFAPIRSLEVNISKLEPSTTRAIVRLASAHKVKMVPFSPRPF